MTVSELIAKLSEYHPDLEVRVDSTHGSRTRTDLVRDIEFYSIEHQDSIQALIIEGTRR